MADGPRTFKRKIFFFFLLILLGTTAAAGGYYARTGTFAPLAITVAAKVIPLFGDHIPAIPSPFGSLHISSQKGPTGTFVEISCRPCRASSEKIGPEPFTLPEAKVSGTFLRGQFRGHIAVEGVQIAIEGIWENNSFRGTFQIPETKISELYHLTRSIVPESEKAEIEGNVSGTGTFVWPQAFVRWKPKISRFKASGLVDLGRYRKGSFSYQAKNGNGETVELQSGEGSPDWLPAEALGKLLPAAVVAAEDGTFYSHPGYDVSSMDEALKENEQSKKIRRGASTLTQQLAKNLFLSSERSYVRKLRELLYAVNLEQLGKARIMELYLNVSEWGPDIHGAKQAGQSYFRKLPKDLLPEEAAWLAGILRSPKRSWTREFRGGRPNLARVAKVINRMTNLSADEKGQALVRKLSITKDLTAKEAS